MSSLPTFEALLHARVGYTPDIRILCIDPGETTGIAIFESPRLVYHKEVSFDTTSQITNEIKRIADYKLVDAIVVEDYRIYSWRAEQHIWSSLFTPRLIGAIEYLGYLYDIPICKQSAGDAKGFATDRKLKAWDMWIEGQRHSRDAIRHGIYFLMFNWEKYNER